MATLVHSSWHFPPWLYRGTVLITAICTVVLYIFLVIGTSIGVYRYQNRTITTTLTERLFPYPAAIVDGTVIPLERVRLQSDALMTYALFHGQPANRADIQIVVIGQIINRLLYKNDLEKHGITITQQAINSQLTTITASAGGADKLSSYLFTEYGPTMDTNNFGDWIVRDSLAEAAVQYQLLTRVTLRHILVAVASDAPPTAAGDAKVKLAGIKARITTPDQFASLANQFSDDIASKDKGGLLGTTGRGTDLAQYSPEFERAAFSLAPGSVSEPIRTTYGWELLLVEKREGSIDMSFADYTTQLRAHAHIHEFLHGAAH